MNNPLFNPGMQGMPGMMGNMANLLQQFQQFRQTFQGNPRQEVERLMREGKISQQQLNQYQAMAQQIAPFLPR